VALLRPASRATALCASRSPPGATDAQDADVESAGRQQPSKREIADLAKLKAEAAAEKAAAAAAELEAQRLQRRAAAAAAAAAAPHAAPRSLAAADGDGEQSSQSDDLDTEGASSPDASNGTFTATLRVRDARDSPEANATDVVCDVVSARFPDTPEWHHLHYTYISTTNQLQVIGEGALADALRRALEGVETGGSKFRVISARKRSGNETEEEEEEEEELEEIEWFLGAEEMAEEVNGPVCSECYSEYLAAASPLHLPQVNARAVWSELGLDEQAYPLAPMLDEEEIERAIDSLFGLDTFVVRVQRSPPCLHCISAASPLHLRLVPFRQVRAVDSGPAGLLFRGSLRRADVGQISSTLQRRLANDPWLSSRLRLFLLRDPLAAGPMSAAEEEELEIEIETSEPDDWSMLMPEPDPIFLAVPAQLQPAARRDSVFDNLLLPVASLVLAAGAAAVLAVDLLPSIEAGMDPGLQPALAGAYPFAGMGAMGAAAGEWQSVGGLQPGLQADAAGGVLERVTSLVWPLLGLQAVHEAGHFFGRAAASALAPCNHLPNMAGA
jgi:hypothetical protein